MYCSNLVTFTEFSHISLTEINLLSAVLLSNLFSSKLTTHFVLMTEISERNFSLFFLATFHILSGLSFVNLTGTKRKKFRDVTFQRPLIENS